METKRINIKLLHQNTGQIKGLAANPRTWTAADLRRLVESIRETPSLLEARGCIVWKLADDKYIVLGGNMRLEACRELGMDSVPCILLPEDMPKEKLAEIVLKDNGCFGNWDYDLLEEGWNADQVEQWGVEKWREQPAPTLDLDGLPDELQGLDINPDELEKLVGDDETARSRVIITYREEDRWRLEEVFGIRDITSKVLWMLEDIVKQRKTEE
jgi:ParB-like chromosome segregation protein Spo0J